MLILPMSKDSLWHAERWQLLPPAMGVGTVMAAKKIVMVITGADKADILYKVFFGPVTPEVPGSILQFHPDVTLICDEAAAARMPQ